MLVREAEKGWAGAGWVGFTLTLRDEGALGPGLTPPPEFICGRDQLGGRATVTTGQPRTTSAPVQRWGGDARGFSETEWGGGRAAIRRASHA